jgi:general secretion pathway protein I
MRQRGFTVIEVVVAFALLAVVLTTVFEIFTSGLARASELDNYSRALAMAQSQLADAGVEEALAEGEARGESEDRQFRWSVAVTPHVEDPADTSKPPPALPYTLYRVEARVGWTSAAGVDRQVALSTLLIQQNK